MADTTQAQTSVPDPAPRPGSLRERFLAWRSRTIANPAFRKFAQRFILTRPTANAHANELYALTAGFVYSQVLRACVELDLLTELNTHTASLKSLALKTAIAEDRLERLLLAAESLGLTRRMADGVTWTIGDTGAVVATNSGIRAMVRHHGDVYDDIADLTGLLREPERQTKTARFWSYVDKADGPGRVAGDDAARYSELMRVTQDMVIDGVLESYDFSRHGSLLDVGGGSGAFVSAVARQASNIKVALIDLPPVADEARKRLADTAFADRLSIHGGSFFDTALPEADCYSLVRVLYDHDDDAALRILENIRAAMRPTDTLLIAEPMAGTKPGEKRAAAYFHVYLLAMRSGRCRSAEDHFALLRRAGFTRMRKRATHLPVATGLIEARL